MGDTIITGPLVWPTQNDLYGSGVSGSASQGKRHLEIQMRKLWPKFAIRNALLTTTYMPASDADLTIPIGAGSAIIDGYYVQWPATNVTVPNNATSFLYLKLVYSSNLVQSVKIEDNTSGTQPANSIALGLVIASGGVITGANINGAPIGMCGDPVVAPFWAAPNSTQFNHCNVTYASSQNLSGIHYYHDVVVNAGVTLTIPDGKRRLILFATNSITINGTIDGIGAGAPGGGSGVAGKYGTDQPSGSLGIMAHGCEYGTAGAQVDEDEILLCSIENFLAAMGGSSGSGGAPNGDTGGAGGNGGGSIVLIAPSIVLGGSSQLKTSGANGAVGTGAGGPGHGGGAGNVYMACHTLSDAGCTYTMAGGSPGSGGTAGAAGVRQLLFY